MESELEFGTDAGNPTRSIYGREYWLRRCEGFLVESPTKRIGRAVGVRYREATNEPEVLEIRAGLLGRTKLLMNVEEISGVDLAKERLSISDPPRLVPG